MYSSKSFDSWHRPMILILIDMLFCFSFYRPALVYRSHSCMGSACMYRYHYHHFGSATQFAASRQCSCFWYDACSRLSFMRSLTNAQTLPAPTSSYIYFPRRNWTMKEFTRRCWSRPLYLMAVESWTIFTPASTTSASMYALWPRCTRHSDAQHLKTLFLTFLFIYVLHDFYFYFKSADWNHWKESDDC